MSTKQTTTILAVASVATAFTLAVKYKDNQRQKEQLVLETQKKTTAPTCKGYPVIGSLPYVLWHKEKLYEFIAQQMEEMDTLTMFIQMLGRPPRVITIDPEIIEYILRSNFANYPKGLIIRQSLGDLLGDGIFTSNGEVWRYQRKMASHIFNVSNFQNRFTEVFVNELDVICREIFDPKIKTQESVDFHDIMHRYTLDSFALLGYGVELKASTNKEDMPFITSFDICQRNCFERLHSPIARLKEAIQSMYLPFEKTMAYHYKVVHEFSNEIVQERRKKVAEGQEFNDLLYRFMVARNQNGEPLNDQELGDNILNFIIAGRDTTAQLLSWTFYNLMLYPRIEKKLVAEIKTHWPKEIQDPTELLYETLRLYPSVPMATRYNIEDDILPDGTFIKEGTTVAYSAYVLGRSKKIWGSDAKDYSPERWIDKSGKLRRETQGRWPVFSGGPRVCLGQNLAILEAIIAMATMLQKYKFSLVPGQDITYLSSLTFPMKYGLKVYIQQRE
ncbi:cytochrome P450 [Phascolomyces articulosus]|uniref:Cytochrome P450 n=1 Tax=Phascolomyces articulosus TaxID=60185 RepID=A0AAD5PG23_9FUNG|nr:cytochrome P450 [Phascolomyces articulosus]